MSNECSASATTLAMSEGYASGLPHQIMEVRVALVTTLMRGMRLPTEAMRQPILRDCWERLEQAVQFEDREAVAEADWALRTGILLQASNGLALTLLLLGDETLRRVCGSRPKAAHPAARLQAMRRLLSALREGDEAAVLNAALSQIELDQHDLMAFERRRLHEVGGITRH